jgi:adenosylhomocysteine nucleosidase
MAESSEAGYILAVVGMTREAKILAPAPVLIGGGDAASLAAKLEDALKDGVRGVVSFGLCGALNPALKLGDLVLGEAATGPEGSYEADLAWIGRMAEALPTARRGRFTHAERPVASIAEKTSLRQLTGADAVDLESYVVGRLARWFGVPFAILRAVSDAASRALPHAAQVGLGRDGRPAVGAVLSSLKSNPWQLWSLVRTALEAEEAFHALESARDLLGPRLSGPDVG